MIETVRRTQRNVKRWREGDMSKRRTAAGVVEAERKIRRIIGYHDLATLVIALVRHARLTVTHIIATQPADECHHGTAKGAGII
jgi:hypothetical protein